MALVSNPMKKNFLLFIMGTLFGAGILYVKDFRSETIDTLSPDLNLQESYQAFAESVEQAGAFVEQHQWYGSDREQAEAYRHILRTLVSSIELHAMSDTDFPYFHEMNPFSKGGMDNSDQRYLTVLLDGEAEYRVWGNRGSSRRLDFTLYKAGSPMAPSYATLSSDKLIADDNGNFSLTIGGDSKNNNWLPGASEKLRLLVRQIHADWSNELPGQLHIDRVDMNKPAYPSLTVKKMARQLKDSTNAFADNLRRWPELSRTRFSMLMPSNYLTPPRDTGSEGGLSGRWMVGGHFNLNDDQALIVSAAPTAAAYQSIQLGHHWWESIDYANRQSSLTLEQSTISSDGRIYYVITKQDPGTNNWLDTGGFDRGVILMRYDGLSTQLEDEQIPSAKLVKVSELHENLPQEGTAVSPKERKTVISQRRKHVQQRFGI